MSLVHLNITEQCKSCLRNICDQWPSDERPIADATARIIVFASLGTAIFITVVTSCTCCYLFKRDDLLHALERRPPRPDAPDEPHRHRAKTSVKKKGHQLQEQLEQQPQQHLAPTPFPTFNQAIEPEEVPTTRFNVPTIQADVIRNDQNTIKTVKSRETVTTGDVAFIAPREDEVLRSKSKSKDEIMDAKFQAKRETPRSPIKLSPKSPLYQIAGRDKFTPIKKRDKEREKAKDKQKDKDKERDKRKRSS